MPLNRLAYRLPVLACGVLLGAGGCAAVPLAQMAATQLAPSHVTPGAVAQPPCADGPGCNTNIASNAFGSLSKGISSSFQSLTGTPTAAPPAAPVR